MKELRAFLRARRLYSAFVRNLKNDRGLTISKYLHPSLDQYNYIISAFAWSQTPEGHDVWSAINEAWKTRHA